MEKREFLDRLGSNILLFDGAIGTQVQARGLKVGESPEIWNLDYPERIEEIHRMYVDAGAMLVTTNTFGGSRIMLEKSGLGDKVTEINVQAAAIAKRAADGKALVAGSVGPTGEFLQPLGTVSPEEMKEDFYNQIKALIEGGADLIIVETMSAVEEACLAVQAAREMGEMPVIGSMTFNAGKQGYRTMMGVDIPTAVNRVFVAGADVVGSNCGNGMDDFIKIVQEMRQLTDRPILAEPNAGLPKLEGEKTVYKESPEEMASKVPMLLNAGANIIGGCCGTTPDHISLFKEAIKRSETS